MKQTVKDVINQLEKLDPNETIFSLIYTKEDVKDFEHYDYQSNETVYPYTNELADNVLSNLDCYDVIYETIHKAMHEEISYQVDQLYKLESIKVEAPSY